MSLIFKNFEKIGIPQAQQRKEEILTIVKTLYYSQTFEEYNKLLPLSLERLRSISEQITDYLFGTWLGEHAMYEYSALVLKCHHNIFIKKYLDFPKNCGHLFV